MIFATKDVGQQFVLVAFFDQTDRDTSDWVTNFHTGSHQAKCGSTDGGHRRRTIGFQDVRHDADRVGEVIRIGKDWLDRTLGQCTVSNFATPWASDWTAFAHTEAWEVVIEHELFGVLVHQAIDALLVATRSQCDRDQRLSFTTLEQGGTVNARDHVGFAFDWTQCFAIAAIRSNACQNRIANDSLFQVMNRSAKCLRADRVVGIWIRDHFRFNLCLDFILGGTPIVLASDQDRILVVVVVLRLQCVEQTVV